MTVDAHVVGDAAGHAAPLTDETLRRLLGAIVYSRVSFFESIASAVAIAPSLTDQQKTTELVTAAGQFSAQVREELIDDDPTYEKELTAAKELFDSYNAKTSARDWFELLVKLYLVDGIIRDTLVESSSVPEQAKKVLSTLNEDAVFPEFVVERVNAEYSRDPQVKSRLALWGRRLVAETITLTHRILHPLTSKEGDGPDQVEGNVTRNHARRMAALNLAA